MGKIELSYLIAKGLRLAAAFQLFYFVFRLRSIIAKGSPSAGSYRALAILALCMSAYLLHIFAFHFEMLRFARVPLILGAWANPVMIWIVTCYLFEDAFQIRWPHIATLVLVETFCAWIFFTSPIPVHLWKEIGSSDPLTFFIRIVLPRFITVIFAVLSILIVRRGYKTDLVEARRKRRGSFVYLISLLAIFVVSNETLGFFLGSTEIPDIFTSLFVMVVAYFMSHESTLPRPFWEVTSRADKKSAANNSTFDKSMHEGLRNLMLIQKVFLLPDLSLPKLAQMLGVPEYKLRNQINKGGGFRNFNEFLNHYRIQEAKNRLLDPDNRDLPIFNLAVDLGYGSLVSFHRAFRQSVGTTPTEFRAQRLGGD